MLNEGKKMKNGAWLDTKKKSILENWVFLSFHPLTFLKAFQ